MLFLQLILLMLALVWGCVLILRGTLLQGCTLLLIASCCFSRQFWSLNAGPLPLSIDRLMLLALCGWYLLHRSKGVSQPKQMTTVDWLFIAFIGWISISTFSHDYTRQFGTMAMPLWKLIGGFLMPASVYWIGRQSRLDERTVRGAYLGLALFGIYLAFTGIMEVMHQWTFVFPTYISNPNIGIHFGRARGPMLSSVPYGTILIACFLALWLIASQLQTRSKVLIAVFVAPLFMAATYFSYTRSVWLGLAGSGFIVAVMSLKGRTRVAVVVSALTVATVVGLTKFDKFLSLEREYSGATSARSAETRLAFAYVSWQMFLDRPVQGFGFGQFITAKWPYLNDQNTDLMLEDIRTRPHHSTLLSLLCETGLIGIALFLATIACWLGQAIWIWRQPDAPTWARNHAIVLCAFMVSYMLQCLFHDFTYTSEINYLLLLLAGITSGITSNMCAERGAANAPRQTATSEIRPTFAPGLSLPR